MHVGVHRTLYLDRLRAIPLLRVELTPVHRLNLHHIVALRVARPLRIVRRRHDGLSGWVEAKVGLIHKLLVETRIDRGVIVLNGLISVRWSGVRVHLLRSVLEKLVQDTFLLLIVNVHAFTLDGTAMRSKTQIGYQQLCKKKKKVVVTDTDATKTTMKLMKINLLELMLSLLVFVVVAGRMASLHTLRVLRRIW